MQSMAIDGFEQKAFESVKFDVTEKMKQLNKLFHSKIEPQDGVYGIHEFDPGNGRLEGWMRNESGLIIKDYSIDDIIYQRREQLDHTTWQNTWFDENGTAYMRRITRKTVKGLQTGGYELIAGVEIHKGNFTSKIDEIGRPIVNKIEDLKLSPRMENLGKKFIDEAYKSGDEQGHIIGDNFGGPAAKENIVAQSFDTNHREMAKIENKVRDLKKNNPDSKIDYEVKVNYDGKTKRPSSFEPKIKIDGKTVDIPAELKKIYNNSDLTNVDKVVTTAKEHLNKATTKVSPFHKAGLEEGMEAAVITCAISTVDNVTQFVSGDISAEDMAVNIAKDTGTAGAVGYATGFVTKAVANTMQHSTNTMLKSLGKCGVPAAIVSFGVESYDTVIDFAQGEIDGMELAYDLGENAASVAGSAAGAALAGAAVGSIIPGAGTAVGFVVGGTASVVGGMVGTAVATGAYRSAVEVGSAGAEVLADKAHDIASETVDAVKEYMPEHVDDVRNALNNFLAENSMPFSV